MLVVDTNRQSLDRVIPDQKIKKVMEVFDGAGWHVVEAKYGSLLDEAFRRPGGHALREHIDAMSNEEYQSLFAHTGEELRERFLRDAGGDVRRLVADIAPEQLAPLVQNLGGHDLGVLLDAYRACDAETERPSVVFAYTVKGWGLPIAGDPLNHAALLTGDADRRAARLARPDGRRRSGTASTRRRRPGQVCAATGGELNNVPVPPRPVLPIPDATNVPAVGSVSTQESFGRVLTRLGDIAGVAEHIVTTSPDVSVSTNLGGWINKVGVFAPPEAADFLGDERLLRWKQSPAGQHIELGISEMNLFLLLHALGPRPRPARPPPAADRDGLRPVRVPRARRPDLRAVLRLPLRRRRHAGGHHAGAGGRRPPVDDHAVDRPRAAGADVRRAGVRPGPRLAAVRRARRAGSSGRLVAVPAAVDAAARPGAVPRRRRAGG